MKTTVGRAFGMAAAHYDAYAAIQKASSEHLAQLCAQVVEGPVKTILDVGAGTGQTTEALKRFFPGRYTLLDLAPEMLQQAQAKFPEVALICADAEEFFVREPRAYDLIASNLAVQWFDDLGSFLKGALPACRVLAFSTLLDASFETYKDVFRQRGILPPTPRYPTQASLLQLLAPWTILAQDVRVYSETFPSASSVARYFQGLGAHKTRPANRPALQAILEHEGPVCLDYHIFFAVLRGEKPALETPD